MSFAVIAAVYALAIAGGIFCYDWICARHDFCWQLSLLAADFFATVIVFLFSVIFGNASVYDPYWSVQPPVILLVALARRGGSPFAWILFAAVLFWGIRLTANWRYNFKSFEYQDWRYVMLKEQTGVFYPLINFLGIHLFPTLVVYLCVLPAATVVAEGAAFKPVCAVFLALAFAAPTFQGIADIQMHRFRKRGTGGFCRDGLWKRSRHPNYACEILMWWSVGLASFFALDMRLPLLAGAAANTALFLFVSVPLADKRQSRKPGFDEYKKQTRML